MVSSVSVDDVVVLATFNHSITVKIVKNNISFCEEINELDQMMIDCYKPFD